MARLKLHLLGTFQLVLEGAPSTNFRSDKARALLAYLAIEGQRPLRRETLAALLWGESPSQKARASLRVALSQLRGLLGPLFEDTDHNRLPLLVADRQSIRFHADHPRCWIDAVEFDAQLSMQQAHHHHGERLCPACVQQLTRAVELYRGPFLDGLSLPDSPAFDEWLTAQQARRDQQITVSLHQLLEHYTALADYPHAIAYARRQLVLEPWHEAAHRSLMWALALSGQHTAALAQYETCRQTLRRELQADPTPSTDDLYRQIRDGALGWDAAGVAWQPPQPYKGLQAFQEHDVNNFFGREALVARLMERLLGRPVIDTANTDQDALPAWMYHFLAIVGPSGSGKSSLVRAGLIPALRRTGDPWFVATMFPGEEPLRELQGALEATLPSGRAGQARDADPAALLADAITERLPPDGRLLLFIDQAEELFTLTRDGAVRSAFTTGLLAALEAVPDRLWVVMTLRADYYDRPLRDPRWSALFHRRMEIAPPLTAEALERVITGPAARVGLTVEPGLVTTLVSAVGRQPGSLPLLQYALTELFQRREGRVMSLAAYRVMGGLSGALAGRAEALYNGLSGAQQAVAQRLFLRLVVLGETSQPHSGAARRRVLRRELERATDDATATAAVLEAFGSHRLLTFDRDPVMGAATVELAHEVLLEAWPRLREWLVASWEQLRLHQRLTTATEEWQRSGQDAGFLAHGLRLAQFEGLQDTGVILSPAETAYLEESLAELTRRQTTEREAALAKGLSLVTGVQLALSEGDTALALALAVEISRVPNPLPQAQLLLAKAAYAPGARRVLRGHDGAIADLALAPGDGSRALSASADGSLLLWNLETGEAIRRLHGHEAAVNAVAFLPTPVSSETGTQAISAASDGTLILWDTETGSGLRYVKGHDGPVWDVAVSPASGSQGATNRMVLSAGHDGTLILWDVEHGEVVRRFSGHEGAIRTVVFSPDGRTVLSGSDDHSLILWDVETGEIMHHLGGREASSAQIHETEMPRATGHEGPVRGIAFAPDGRTAYSVADDRRLITWDLATGTPLRASVFGVGADCLDISSDGRYLLLGTRDGRIILWIPYYGQAVLELLGHTGRVSATAFGTDGRQAVSSSADGSICLWDLRHGAETRSLIYDRSALDVALSPDGKQMLLASVYGDLTLWDSATGVEIRRFVGHTEPPFAGVCFGPPDDEGHPRFAVSGAGDVYGMGEDNTLRVWNLETGQEIQLFEGHTQCLWDIDVDPQGHFAVSGSADGTVRLWDLQRATGRVLIDFRPQAVRSVAFSPDGQTVLIGLLKGTSDVPDYGLRLVARETGTVIRIFSGHTDSVADITFSPGGHYALSAGQDRRVILWDAATGSELQRLVGHTGAVNVVRFSPDGRFALSAGMDNLIILWDMESGAALRHYTGHAGGITGIAFTPQGHSFLSIALDDSVREWRIDANQDALLVWIAANRQVSDLLPKQRARYLGFPQSREY